MVLVLGEVWIRLPATADDIQYAFDEEIGHRYAPNQVAYPRALGAFALEVPPIVIDGEGYRNGPVDWNRPIILALGSSEVVGPSVSDEEIWTARLTRRLRRGSGDDPIVYNAGIGGYGPFHSSVVLQRFIEKHEKPVLVIVRVAIGDRSFLPFTPEQLREEKSKKKKRDAIKKYTLFLPFLYNKATLQLDSVKSVLSVYLPGGRLKQPGNRMANASERMWKQNKEYWFKIAALCKKMGIPVLFFVHNPLGAPEDRALFNTFAAHFQNKRCDFVWMLDDAPFGLQGDLNERRSTFAAKYTLGYDPHANSFQHQVIADEMFKYLKTAHIPLNGNLTCA